MRRYFHITGQASRLTFLPQFSLFASNWIFIVLRFLYEGNRINDDDTPGSLDMEENGLFSSRFKVSRVLIRLRSLIDTIDVMVERTSPQSDRFLFMRHSPHIVAFLQRSEDRLLSLDRELCSLYFVVFFSSTQCKIQIRFLACHINEQKTPWIDLQNWILDYDQRSTNAHP